MSRTIDPDKPLTAEDRKYLVERGNYALIKKMDDEHGTAPDENGDTEEGLAARIAELEAEANELRGRQTQLRIAREQREAQVRDNTVVDGQGGSENRQDDYEDRKWTRDLLAAEIERRNEGRDDEYKMSSSGTKAQLIERLRADDEEEDEEDEDDE